MKQFVFLFMLILFGACAEKKTEVRKSDSDDNQQLEHYFEKLLSKKVTATVYIVHPEVCGACSNDFLVKMSQKDLDSKFYLLATGAFKEEHREAAERIKDKIRFVDSEKLGRIGLNTQFAQKLLLKNGKVMSVEIIKL